MGIETGMDVDRLAAVSRSLEDFFGWPFSGKIQRFIGKDDIKIVC
jgi:hypothetical protein